MECDLEPMRTGITTSTRKASLSRTTYQGDRDQPERAVHLELREGQALLC